MEIPVKVKSLEISPESNVAEAVIEFNSRDFNANIFPKGVQSDILELEIPGIDLKNLEKAGFQLELTELREKYDEALKLKDIDQQKATKQYRGKIYSSTRLHELKEFLQPYFSIMSLDEFLQSKSGALYAYYKFNYRDYCKELSIFMDHDKFVVYDQLNQETIASHSSEPSEVRKLIDDYIRSWKHKVDFKLALMQEVEDNEKEKDPTQTISATEYFKQLQEKDKVHEDEVRENHRKYLKMLGKLGDSKEIQDHTDQHSAVEETDSIDKKRLLGSLSDTEKIKIRHLFEDN